MLIHERLAKNSELIETRDQITGFIRFVRANGVSMNPYIHVLDTEQIGLPKQFLLVCDIEKFKVLNEKGEMLFECQLNHMMNQKILDDWNSLPKDARDILYVIRTLF